VPPGGSAALACLRSNLANLSAACQKAVNAASPGGGARSTGGPCRACPHSYSSAGSSDSSGARRRAHCGASACSRASGPASSGGGKARCA
jgi:hypothetical protein